MEPLSIVIAFALGFAVRQIGLPPLVGYLVAGFALHSVGVRPGIAVAVLSEAGITLLLFTVGLKLRIGTLMRAEVWGVATAHMAITVVLVTFLVWTVGGFVASVAGLPLQTVALTTFALSFSSTVFAVKVLEERGEMASAHGRITIGILVMQDILAVLYLAVAQGKTPTLYAAVLFGIPLLLPVFRWVLARSGHGELMALFGFTLAIGGAALFELVGIKGGVGALVLGVMLSSTRQATELSKALLTFKDVFLIGFFLSIGLAGVPESKALALAALMLFLLPCKAALMFVMLTAGRVRVRTAVLASLALANYSEFGLIVAAIAVSTGTLSEPWVTALAVALALSFVISAPLNVFAHRFYGILEPWVHRYERTSRAGDKAIDLGGATVMVCGMGRVGSSAYDEMARRYGDSEVIGVDQDEERVASQTDMGRHVVKGDVTDPDFWEQVNCGKVKLVMLAMPNHAENLVTTRQLRGHGFDGAVAATALFPDEVIELGVAGITEAYNLRSEAGVGFAELSCSLIRGSLDADSDDPRLVT